MNKKLFFQKLAQKLRKNKNKILAANQQDLQIASKKGNTAAFLERLKMHNKDINSLINRVKEVGIMEEFVGTVIEDKVLHNGIKLQKVSVPIGTILVIYESRPEVTVDVAILGIKSENRVVLKGGSEAANTNKILFDCIQEALKKSKMQRECVQLLKSTKRKELYDLLKQKETIDLVIARGGYKMVRQIQEKSKIPVLAHSSGGARIYVDKSADFAMALDIIMNAKTSKPAACNSIDTILVHEKIAHEFIPMIKKQLEKRTVKVLENPDWNKESLDLVVGIKIVKDANEAITFIKKYTKKHTEGIVACNKKVIELFKRSIDAATLCINCSTRLHDGGVFEMGAEMGIATGKLHARGPVGVRELMTYKWVMEGKGQIRQ